MKTTFSILILAFAGGAMLQSVTFQSYANEVVQRETGVKLARQGSVAKPAVSEQAQNVLLRSRPGPAKEVSPAFQVSDDPRDQVRVSISNKIVTVEGSVGSDLLAQKVLKNLAQIAGVREVRNHLKIRRNPDAEIAAGVREALSRDPTTHVGGIAVTVFKGTVFLSGTVSSDEERTRAEELARSWRGVVDVNNGLRTPTTARVNTARFKPIPRRYTRTR